MKAGEQPAAKPMCLQTRCTRDQHVEWTKTASDNGMTLSEALRMAMLEWNNKYSKKRRKAA